jgi:hypothetical protein
LLRCGELGFASQRWMRATLQCVSFNLTTGL